MYYFSNTTDVLKQKMNFQQTITDIASSVKGFNLIDMYKLPQNSVIFDYAKQFLSMHTPTNKAPSHPTSVTWAANFATWLAEEKDYHRWSYPFEFDNVESETTWVHDMLILAAGYLGITLVPTKHLHGFHNRVYKMGIS